MLESVSAGGPWGRYSYYAWDPVSVVTSSASGDDPFDLLARLTGTRCAWDGPRPFPFIGGWIGFLCYEAGRFVEPSAPFFRLDRSMPMSRFRLYDTLLVHEVGGDQWSVVGVELPGEYAAGRPPLADRLARFEQVILRCSDAAAGNASCEERSSRREAGWCGEWAESEDEYLARVERALEYIRAGDIFQVNLARCCRIGAADAPIDLYSRLCRTNAASHAAFIPLDESTGRSARDRSSGAGPASAILSSSPELFLSVQGRQVITRPIKGTRPRTGSPETDCRSRAELAASEKDRAELNMIIDLERNDLGRVCEFGSVRVESPGDIEAHPTVFHTAATITGRLRDDSTTVGLLRACFPGGSVTGAPKVRAMQIISELEAVPRGPYCGAIGYIGLDGDMQLNLPIRTLSVRDGVATLHVGSGIVADSRPDDELAELAAKAAGMFAALAARPEALHV